MIQQLTLDNIFAYGDYELYNFAVKLYSNGFHITRLEEFKKKPDYTGLERRNI